MDFLMNTEMSYSSINKVKVENRDYIVSKLQTGDLLKVSTDTLSIVYHYGIVDKSKDGLFIYHNHPDKVNSVGGNVVRESLENWIKGRDILGVEKTGMDISDIEAMYASLKKEKYNFLHFNCEHVVNFAKGNNFISPQVIKWTSIAIVGLITYIIIRKRR